MVKMDFSSRAAPVSFVDVSKVFGKDVVAVDNISMRVEAGRLVTLLGPSGCGKTTTLRMIAGLEMATSGRILIGDKDVTKLPRHRPRCLDGVSVLRVVSPHDGNRKCLLRSRLLGISKVRGSRTSARRT